MTTGYNRITSHEFPHRVRAIKPALAHDEGRAASVEADDRGVTKGEHGLGGVETEVAFDFSHPRIVVGFRLGERMMRIDRRGQERERVAARDVGHGEIVGRAKQIIIQRML